MKNWHDSNISFTDCTLRYILGIAVILGVIMLYLKAWISLLSIYLMGTALSRWDPFYWMLNHMTGATRVKAGKPQLLKED